MVSINLGITMVQFQFLYKLKSCVWVCIIWYEERIGSYWGGGGGGKIAVMESGEQDLLYGRLLFALLRRLNMY